MTNVTMTREELVSRRVTIDEQIDRLTQEKEQINATLRATCQMGNNDAGDWTVQLRRNARLDTARLEQRFPVAQYPHLYVPKISTPAVRENFSPVELKQFEVEGEPIVVIR